MKRIYSVHYVILLISCMISLTTIAQQKPFALTYQLAGLGSNKSNTYYPITIKGNRLSYTLLNDKKKAVVHEMSIRQSSVDSIIRAVRIFYKDTTVFVANKCIMSGGVHYMTVQTPQANVKFEMMNTFTPAAYKIAQILDKYLPEVLRLNITKEYVAAAWDCDLTIKSIGAAKGIEEQLFDSFCVRLILENEYKKIADQVVGNIIIVEDPITGKRWVKFEDSTNKIRNSILTNRSDEEQVNIMLGYDFPCLPLKDTVFIIDASEILTKTYQFKKDGVVFLITRNFVNRQPGHQDSCSIQLFGLTQFHENIKLFFKLPNNSKTIYTVIFQHNKSGIRFDTDQRDDDRFEHTYREYDPFW